MNIFNLIKTAVDVYDVAKNAINLLQQNSSDCSNPQVHFFLNFNFFIN